MSDSMLQQGTGQILILQNKHDVVGGKDVWEEAEASLPSWTRGWPGVPAAGQLMMIPGFCSLSSCTGRCRRL